MKFVPRYHGIQPEVKLVHLSTGSEDIILKQPVAFQKSFHPEMCQS